MDAERAWKLQQALADHLKAGRLLDDPAIEAAFRLVPRHLFLPDLDLETVYSDEAIATKFQEDGRPISSSSQPAIMAIMLAQLELAPGQRVLEIGAGTGYNAALIANIVGEAGSVTTVDIDQDIVDTAKAHLRAAGMRRVKVACADGFEGFFDNAPYDRIILTVGSADIAPAWWMQLAQDGRLVLPLDLIGHNTMVSVAFARREGYLESVSVRPCGFMMLRGVGEDDGYCAPVGQDGMYLAPHEHEQVDPAVIAREMANGARDFPCGVSAAVWQLERDIRLWLARLGLTCFVLCRRRSHLAEQPAGAGAIDSRLGVLRNGALCVLTLHPSSSYEDAVPEVWVSYYGEAGALAREVARHLREWQEARCPSAERLRIRAHPAGVGGIAPGQIVIEKPNVRLMMDWQLGG